MENKKVFEKNGFYYTNKSQLLTIAETTMELESYNHVDFRDKVVLDIGACAGSFARLAYQRGCEQYIGVEPDPENFFVLQLNNHNKNSVLIEAAVTNSDGEWVSFYEANTSNKTIGYTDSEYTRDLNKKNRIEKKVRSINFWKLLDQYKPDIIKCDIEGGEFELFDNYLPDYVTEVIMEIHVMNKPEKLMKLWYDIFGKTFLGYRWKCTKQPNYSTRTINVYNGLNVFTIGFKREHNWTELEKLSRFRALNSSLKRNHGEDYSIDEPVVRREIYKYCESKNIENIKRKISIRYDLDEFINYKIN